MNNRRRSSMQLTIAALVVVGALAFAACSSTSTAETTIATTTTVAATTTSSTSTTTTTTTIPPTTTTTQPPIITEGAVVLVANASSVNGGAGQLTSALKALGFATAKATNAAGIEDKLELSKIYYLPDGLAAAESIARIMGDIPIFPMPTPAWITGGSDALGSVNVLVMLGNDRAERPLPGLIG